TFSSDTDTEIFAHLVSNELEAGRGLADAVRGSIARVRGTYSLVVCSSRFPDEIVATKSASPLVVGLGQGENFVAIDVPALLEHTRGFVFMEEGDLVVVRKEGVRFFGPSGKELRKQARRVDWAPMMAEKDGDKHFMLKEIHEQPRA